MKELLRQKAATCQLVVPYMYESGIFRIERSLTAPGVEIVRKKQEMPVPYEEIEPDEPEVRHMIIRDAIRKLNELPFLATMACCQGHLKDKVDGIQLDENTRFLWGGWLSFLFDPRWPSHGQFFDRLASLIQPLSYIRVNFNDAEDYVSFTHGSSNDRYGLPSCAIEFDLGDFSSDGNPIDPAEGIIVSKIKGEQRVDSYDHFWRELSIIVE